MTRTALLAAARIAGIAATEVWARAGGEGRRGLDGVVDVRGAVGEGSEPTAARGREFWTFTRPVGANRWTPSAIQSPAT